MGQENALNLTNHIYLSPYTIYRYLQNGEINLS
uniref:Uncharacterized protein n=1 Tax=Arundo donax TaxID=35708 RepID=A0A0A9GS69_ARUDO